MIKTTDLMLGNYVVCRVGGNDSDKRSIPMKVVALFDDCAYLDFDGNEGDVWEEYDKDLFGIKLTQKLLKELAFEKSDTDDCEFIHIEEDIIVCTSVYKNNDFYVSQNGINDVIAEVKYLHELQNAYHLLTGKDLEVKL